MPIAAFCIVEIDINYTNRRNRPYTYLRRTPTDTVCLRFRKTNQDGVPPKFGGWGTGYCALTYSSRDREDIKQQPEHHLGLGYADELRELLEENDVSYNLDYFDKTNPVRARWLV